MFEKFFDFCLVSDELRLDDTHLDDFILEGVLSVLLLSLFDLSLHGSAFSHFALLDTTIDNVSERILFSGLHVSIDDFSVG